MGYEDSKYAAIWFGFQRNDFGIERFWDADYRYYGQSVRPVKDKK